MKRLFIAVDMPPSVIKELKRIQKFLKKEDLFRGRYVNPEHAHLTLKFLGDTDESQIPLIQERLKNIRYKKIKAHLGTIDLFKSSTDMPHVIFLSIICPELKDLAQQIDVALSDVFPSESRPFVSHLTIARIKEISDYDILKDLINSCNVEQIAFDIDSFVLKESVFSSDGPSYSDVETYFIAT